MYHFENNITVLNGGIGDNTFIGCRQTASRNSLPPETLTVAPLTPKRLLLSLAVFSSVRDKETGNRQTETVPGMVTDANALLSVITDTVFFSESVNVDAVICIGFLLSGTDTDSPASSLTGPFLSNEDS